MKSAIDACCDDEFFHEEESADDKKFSQRLRAVNQNIIAEFGEQMHREDHTHATVDPAVENAERPSPLLAFHPINTNANHVRDLMDQSKGRQTPGSVNSSVISELIVEQCQHWDRILDSFTSRIIEAVRCTSKSIIEHDSDGFNKDFKNSFSRN
ncbi:hypothetical protein BDP55DRAFT_651984 [Colletotrichum godetiae]|uniref:Uncharacterized protein n=1 Tax=Colletotrichum godetiae TaxID=1209918 RepID=A0AAJ0AU85_9PEZI|nr:uncharacterized protein BDP55DRAFT_651984 [Colletotrichum godetiae]KAK1689903.1 hypothetical protein BDP55DRAFT_651984 [Colletotrichum godetiae]